MSPKDGLWGAPPTWSQTLVTHLCPPGYCDCNGPNNQSDTQGCLLIYDDPSRLCYQGRYGEWHKHETYAHTILHHGNTTEKLISNHPPCIKPHLCLGTLCGQCANGSGVGLLSMQCREYTSSVPQAAFLLPLYGKHSLWSPKICHHFMLLLGQMSNSL